MNRIFNINKYARIGVLAAVLTSPYALAQESSVAQMSFSDLIARAEYAIENNEHSAAIPVLKEIIARAGELDDDDARKSVQMARLQLGSASLKLTRFTDARTYAKAYLAGNPVEDRMAALQIVSQAAMAEKNWEELKQYADMMLAEQAGLKDTETARQFLLQALFGLREYQAALELLPEVMNSTNDPDRILAYRIIKIRCLFETGRIDELITLLPVMFRGDSRENISLNLTLLRMGDQLFDRTEYRKALAIYRLVMPKTDLLRRQREKLEAYQSERGVDAAKIEESEQALKQLQSVPDYDIHIAFRAAQIYSEQKRFWEAVVLFEQLYKKHPEKDQGKAAYFQKVLVLFTLGADEEAVAESIDYLESNPSGLYPRLICTRLAQHYVQQGALDKALALGSRFADQWTPPADEPELAQETDLRYLFSFAHFKLGDYEEAYDAFDRVIQMAPDSQAAIDSNYWKAMCRLLQQNYEVAYEQFMNYRQRWPRASFAPAALFRAGVCRFGLEDYTESKRLLKTFIDEYPSDAQMPEALSMYGDLLAADGRIDAALAHYQRALKIVEENVSRTTDPMLKKQMVAPATYAVLQAAQALEADAGAYAEQEQFETAEMKYRRIIQWMERYMKSFGENGSLAEAVFWIGKAQVELGNPAQAVASYLDTVIEYGTDPSREGVTEILFDLADIIRNRLPSDQFQPTVAAIQDARNRAASRTLQIRLDVLLAELEGTGAALGRRLLEREKTLDDVPQSGLALMSSALMEQNDYSRSKEFFDHFAEHYKSSPFRVTAYQLRAEDLYAQGDLDGAYTLAEEALGLYGAISETGWAQLMKGKIELARAEPEEAVKTFHLIFKVPAWRGPIAAEAMFRMAEAREQQGNCKKAYALFERTYLLYKAYDDGRWAAEGYLRGAECLEKMDRPAAARNVYRAMLLDKYVRDLPQAEQAKRVLGPEETAALLAGSTNTMETVEKESDE